MLAQTKKISVIAHKRLAIFYWISIMHRVKIIKDIFMNESALKIIRLNTSIITDSYTIHAVDDVNFTMLIE